MKTNRAAVAVPVSLNRGDSGSTFAWGAALESGATCRGECSSCSRSAYTRLKRFKKYLMRAMRQQSSCTVPRDTWDYLLSKRPYRDAKHIQWTLKQARHLKRKCYDSLPFLTAALCPHVQVPTITQCEKKQALDLFQTIDFAVQNGPFVSYLFCLEYILRKLGRSDMCSHINRIQCPKRREKYTIMLDGIFRSEDATSVTSLLRTPA